MQSRYCLIRNKEDLSKLVKQLSKHIVLKMQGKSDNCAKYLGCSKVPAKSLLENDQSDKKMPKSVKGFKKIGFGFDRNNLTQIPTPIKEESYYDSPFKSSTIISYREEEDSFRLASQRSQDQMSSKRSKEFISKKGSKKFVVKKIEI